MKKTKNQHQDVKKLVAEIEFKQALREAADKSAKLALEIVNSTK